MPEQLKAAIRPAYRRFFQGISQEADANIAIDRFGDFEFAYRAGTTDKIIVGNIASYELSKLVPSYTPKRTDTIINIGAHIGAFVLAASTAVPDGAVFGIEASKETYNLLRINIALNKANNIFATQAAITNNAGPCVLYYDTGHWGHSITKQLSTRTETVEGITLDDFMRRNKIERCNMMFLNCEGAEFPILLGASRDTLQKIDVISADCHTHLWTKNTPEDLVRHLADSGFSATLVENEGTYDRIVATTRRSDCTDGTPVDCLPPARAALLD